ncbi:MAG: hypothetical protein IRZ14_06140 [Chloroflexi bacterium]|nr:hypothetical protein [Chloroflexota bacterium]
MRRWLVLAQGMWALVRELDWRPIRAQAETPPRIALLGAGPLVERVTRLLGTLKPVARGPLDLPLQAPLPDLTVLLPGQPEEVAAAMQRAAELEAQDAGAVVLVPAGHEPSPPGGGYVVVDPAAPESEEQLALTVLDATPSERKLALGRACLPLRGPLARQLCQETAMANAQFALLANLPAALPGVGAAGVGADIVILTKNQILLVYKLAALWGARLDSPRALFLELAPVVGGAFFWRTTARALLGLVPGFAAVAPKVAVAYLGTYIVGGLASAYYASGMRPDEARVREIEHEARQALAQAWRRLRPHDRRAAVEPAAAVTPPATPAPAH